MHPFDHESTIRAREMDQLILTIATSMGALKPGWCTASTVFPKHMKVVMSIVIALYANAKSAD